MLKLSLCGAFSLVSFVSGAIIPRADPPFQFIPATSKPDNTFNNGKALLGGEPKGSTDIPPAIYGVRSIDIPFGRLYHGNMRFFKKGQLNTPDGDTDHYRPGVNDFANQSACGIPDNAFLVSKVAIHPYFLKYADLSRYCMQDVCISFWKEDGSSDMMLKVMDICDPAECKTPADIKVVRTKVQVMEKLTGKPLSAQPQLTGDQFPEKTWWFFTKCWADGLAQPAYQGPPANNWFTTPHLPNNIKWAMSTDMQQYKNNQIAYKAKGWPTYPQGAYNTHRNSDTSPPITDWVPGQEPAWAPIAGGKGWGKPQGTLEQPSAAIPETPAQPPAEQQPQQSEPPLAITPVTTSLPAPALSIAEVQATPETQVQQNPETAMIPPVSNVAPAVPNQPDPTTAPIVTPEAQTVVPDQSVPTSAPLVLPEAPTATSATSPSQTSPIALSLPVDPAQDQEGSCEEF